MQQTAMDCQLNIFIYYISYLVRLYDKKIKEISTWLIVEWLYTLPLYGSDGSSSSPNFFTVKGRNFAKHDQKNASKRHEARCTEELQVPMGSKALRLILRNILGTFDVMSAWEVRIIAGWTQVNPKLQPQILNQDVKLPNFWCLGCFGYLPAKIENSFDW